MLINIILSSRHYRNELNPDSKYIVPSPVTFNCWKHHAGFIRNQIGVLRNNFYDAQIKKLLLIIGNSQMDIYLGQLSPEEICKEIIAKLKKSGNYSRKKFREWISDRGEDYKMLKLSDKSVWTLRLGDQPNRYIHIHPGRYSTKTIRAKALTLKTTIAFLIKCDSNNIAEIKLEIVNNIRKKILNAPPLKSLSHSSGTGKLIGVLKETKSE